MPKSIISRLTLASSNYYVPIYAFQNVKLCGESVEIVDNAKHLGNIFFNNIYKRDMKALVSDFYKRSNAVIVSFNVCDSQTLNHLHPVFIWH